MDTQWCCKGVAPFVAYRARLKRQRRVRSLGWSWSHAVLSYYFLFLWKAVYATKIGLRPFGQFNVHFAHSRSVLSARYTLETRGNETSFSTKVSRRGQGLNLWRWKTKKGLMSSRCGEKERKTRNQQKPVCLLLRLLCSNRVGEREQSKTR